MSRSAPIGILLAVLLCAALSAAALANDDAQQSQDGVQQGAQTGADSQKPSDTDKSGKKQDENKDLDRIPDSSQQSAPSDAKAPNASAANQRIYLEDAVIPSALRDGLIVPSPQVAPAWEERLFFDARKEWNLRDGLNLTISDRFNFRAEGDISFPNHENIFNEFREAYLSWQPAGKWYLDAGRINLKNGAALGFNPTDFFKTRSVIEPLSADPSVLREDRLGTFMLQTQYLGQGRALTVAFAPALTSPGAIPNNTTLPTFDPGLDRTNGHTRLLVKGSIDIGNDFSPVLLYYREGNANKFGVNLTHSFGQSIVAYGDWAGGSRSNLIDQALAYGRETGTLPVGSPSVLPDDPGVHFQNDLAVGASYTTTKKIAFNLEYHFHEAGFSRADWNNWFATGQAQSGSSFVAKELWYIRSYALDQQEPVARHSTFLRADWVDAFVPNLEITGFINTDLYDGSSLTQASADYYISRSWTIGAQVNANVGSRHSDFGSLPQSVGALFKLARYF